MNIGGLCTIGCDVEHKIVLIYHYLPFLGVGIVAQGVLLFARVNQAADPSVRRSNGPVRVVALATFPVEAAATRFRIAQFIEPLASANIAVTLLPFLTAADFEGLYDRKRAPLTALRLFLAFFRRLTQLPRILTAEVLFVQREAMLFGPPLIEWLATSVARIPMVLDLDDATWIPMVSPVYGRMATMLKWPSKAEWLIRRACIVICGNDTIAEHVLAAGRRTVVMPTIVDSRLFEPRKTTGENDRPIVGWIGSHGTWSYLAAILPALERVAESTPFRLRIIGSGQTKLSLRGIEVELLPWRMETEVADVQSFDIGLYPLPDDTWASAKSGLKAIQYLACGVPYVASPVGVVRQIGKAGVTHLHAISSEEWGMMLERLLRDREARGAMGVAGRRYMIEHYATADFAAKIAEVLHEASSGHTEAYA